MSTRYFTESEVAERTRISLGTLRRWRMENKGLRYFKFGYLVSYSEDHLPNGRTRNLHEEMALYELRLCQQNSQSQWRQFPPQEKASANWIIRRRFFSAYRRHQCHSH